MFAINRNSYLQARCASLDPKTINRCVDRALAFQIPFDVYDLEPPFQRLTSEQPNIPIENCDVTRRPQAFDRLALPKLKRELHEGDETDQMQALNSICDLIRDPEKAYQALNLKIPDRLADLLVNDFAPIRESSAFALLLFAHYEQGKAAIVKNNKIMAHLKELLNDSKLTIRIMVADCLELLSRSWVVADDLVCLGFIEFLQERVTTDVAQVAVSHLTTLEHLMYDVGVNAALNLNAFDTFTSLLDHKSTEVVCKSLDCLTIITATKEGKKIAMEKQLLKQLNKIIQYGDTKVCTSAVPVIMFCTVKTKAKHMAAEIKNLERRLVQLSRNVQNRELQLFCLKALTNICEHPLIRKQVQDHHIQAIEQLQVGSNKKYKEILLQVINWLPEKLE